jgi:hypothetical protein
MIRKTEDGDLMINGNVYNVMIQGNVRLSLQYSYSSDSFRGWLPDSNGSSTGVLKNFKREEVKVLGNETTGSARNAVLQMSNMTGRQLQKLINAAELHLEEGF